MIRLVLVACAPTAATRRAAFPLDEPLDDKGLAEATALAPSLRKPDRALTSPALRARQTAAALALDAVTADALRDLDCGGWAGATAAEIHARDPRGFAAWLQDANATPHGGEPVARLLARTRAWMRDLAAGDGRVIAVTHAPVIRAAIVTALEAPFPAFWRIDVPPLGRVSLNADGDRWRLRAMES